MQITLGQQYNVGEKPTVILYIYINGHVGYPCFLVFYFTHSCSDLICRHHSSILSIPLFLKLILTVD